MSKSPKRDSGRSKSRGKIDVASSAIENLLNECMARVNAALRASSLRPTTKEHYGETAQMILKKLSPVALDRHHRNAKGFRFYASHAGLKGGFLKKYPEAKERVKKATLKGVFDRDGILHLNGGGIYAGKEVPLSQFFAHEITHSIDGNDHEISESKEWKEAWEKDKESFTSNGQKTPAEGFAEFGQRFLASALTNDQIRELWPNCFEVWQRNQL